MENKKEKMSLQEFKDKVEKITFMKEIGMLSEEDVERLKKELLVDVYK